MPETCTALIEAAADDGGGQRSVFAHRYLPAVRTYLTARWRGTGWIGQVDDAVQAVFVECFRERGALRTFDARRGGSFRAFLFGVVRNVALRVERDESRMRRQEIAVDTDHLRAVASRSESHSTILDRCFAQSIMAMARERMRQNAGDGQRARRRYELLRLRFEESLPIREIARRWRADAALLHREYRLARQEFRTCLEQVVAVHLVPSGDALAEVDRLLCMLGQPQQRDVRSAEHLE